MAVQLAEGLASGGWDSLDNIIASIGALYPAQQRDRVKSETVQAAGGTGQTFRPTAPENLSMVETAEWRKAGWQNSPYQEELSVGYKSAESQQLAAVMGQPADPVRESLEWALGRTEEVTTLYDQLRPLWDPREVITETPRIGYPEGRDVRHFNETVEKGAGTTNVGTAWLGGITDQVKGLFNLGFEQGKQAAFSIEHELEPTAKIGIGVIVAAIILFLLLRKR